MRTSTSTPSPRTGPRASWRSSTTSNATASSTSSRSPTTSASTRPSPRRAMARDRGLSFEVVVGEEVTTLGGHLLALWIETGSSRSARSAQHDRGDPRAGRACHPGAPARALSAVRPGLHAPPSPRRRAALPPGRDRGVQSDDARAAVARPGGAVRRGARPRPHRQLRRPCARRGRVRLLHLPGPRRRRPPRGDRGRDDPPARNVPRDGRAARDVPRAAPEVRPGCARQPRRPASRRRDAARPRLPARRRRAGR